MTHSIQQELVNEQKYIDKVLATRFIDLNSDVASFISTDVANNYGSSPILSLFYRGIKLYYKDTVQQRIDTIENLLELYDRRKEEEFRDYQIHLSMQANQQEIEPVPDKKKALVSSSENIDLISNLDNSIPLKKKSEKGTEKKPEKEIEEKTEEETEEETEKETEKKPEKEIKKDSKSIFKDIQTEFKSLVKEINVIKTRMYDIINSETTKIDSSNNFQDILNTVSSLSKFDNYAKKAPSIKSMLEFLTTKVNIIKKEASDKREYYSGESKSKLKTACYWSLGFLAWTYNWCKYSYKTEAYSIFIKQNISPLISSITTITSDMDSAITIIDRVTKNQEKIVNEDINNIDKIKISCNQTTKNMATIFERLRICVDA